MSQKGFTLCVLAGSGLLLRKDCGSVRAFQQRRDEAPSRGQELLDQIAECAREQDITALREPARRDSRHPDVADSDKFDRRKVNCRLRQYAIGDTEWRRPQEGTE